MKDILQTIREAVVLYFAPLASVWFWLAVILATIIMYGHANG